VSFSGFRVVGVSFSGLRAVNNAETLGHGGAAAGARPSSDDARLIPTTGHAESRASALVHVHAGDRMMSARASGTVRTPNADPACVRDLGRTLPTLASRAPLCAPRIAHDGGVSGRLSRPRQQSSPAGLCGSTGRAPLVWANGGGPIRSRRTEYAAEDERRGRRDDGSHGNEKANMAKVSAALRMRAQPRLDADAGLVLGEEPCNGPTNMIKAAPIRTPQIGPTIQLMSRSDMARCYGDGHGSARRRVGRSVA
jgi:hypothetical protein